MPSLRVDTAEKIKRVLAGLDDDAIDKLSAAYRSEEQRWSMRRINTLIGVPDRFVLDRVNEGNASNQFTTIKLTKRECKDRHDAVSWLHTYTSRAAMRAALAAL